MPDADAQAQPDSLRHHAPYYVPPPEEWRPEDGGSPPARQPGEATCDYAARCGWLALNAADRLGFFDTPEAEAIRTRRDRKAREYWGVEPKPKHRRLVRQHRAPLAIQRRRVHRERRPGSVRVARRRSTSASRDGPDDPDPSSVVARAAGVIAAPGVHRRFPELRYLLGTLLTPAEALQAFVLLPADQQEAAWDSLPRTIA